MGTTATTGRRPFITLIRATGWEWAAAECAHLRMRQAMAAGDRRRAHREWETEVALDRLSDTRRLQLGRSRSPF